MPETQEYHLVKGSLKSYHDQRGFWKEGVYERKHGSTIKGDAMIMGNSFPHDHEYKIVIVRKVEVPGRSVQRYFTKAFKARTTSEINGLKKKTFSDRIRLSKKEWTGAKTFSVPKGEIHSALTKALSKTWQLGSLPEMTAIEISALLEDPNDPQNALLTIGYRSLRNLVNHPGPNTVVISIRTKALSFKLLKDVNGNQIQGEDVDNPLFYYEIVKGESQGTRYLAEIILRTSMMKEDINWEDIDRITGEINNDNIGYLGISQEHLKCVNAGVPKYHVHYDEHAPIPLVFQFLWNPQKWNAFTKVVKKGRVPFQEPVIHCDKMGEFINAMKNQTGSSFPSSGDLYVSKDKDITEAVALINAKKRIVHKDMVLGGPESRKIYKGTPMKWVFALGS